MAGNDLKYNDLTELHTHVGGSVKASTMWEIAHEQGIKMPSKDYWAFKELITANPNKLKNLKGYTEIFHLTELIQSSPQAMEKCVYEIAGGAYRNAGITKMEMRYNPMNRNREGERDLDHIIFSTIQGIDTAMLHYPIQVGIILCLDTRFSYEKNKIIASKALKYHKRGIIGIDVAGPKTNIDFKEMKGIYEKCKREGLGTTIHAGEEHIDELPLVLEYLKPKRIGHGIQCYREKEIMREIAKQGIVLEICPSSNLITHTMKNVEELKQALQTIIENKIKITINTDGTEINNTNMQKEIRLLLENKVLTKQQLHQALRNASEASFITEQNDFRK